MEQIGRKSGYGEGTQQDSLLSIQCQCKLISLRKTLREKRTDCKKHVLHARKSKEIASSVIIMQKNK